MTATELKVYRGDFESRMLLTGELEAVTGDPLIVPRLPSWRVQIRKLVEDGTLVKAGQTVVEFDTTESIGDLQQKELAEAEAESSLLQKLADVKIQTAEKDIAVERARIELEKAKIDAAVPEDIRPRREYQEAQLKLERATVGYSKAVEDRDSYAIASNAEIENLRLTLEKARREVLIADEAIETMILRAPRDGLLVVTQNYYEDRKWQVGDSVHVGLEVAEIPDLSAMIVQARLNDVDDGKITPGMPVACTLDMHPGSTIGGVIREIGPIAQEWSYNSMQRYFQVTIDLERSDPETMRPGMSVKVEVATGRFEDVLLAPRAAIDFQGETPLLLLDDGDKRRVRLGMCNPQVCIIKEGADEGDGVRIVA